MVQLFWPHVPQSTWSQSGGWQDSATTSAISNKATLKPRAIVRQMSLRHEVWKRHVREHTNITCTWQYTCRAIYRGATQSPDMSPWQLANQSYDMDAFDPTVLPQFVERKGSLFLRSDHMNYGRGTLNSNWFGLKLVPLSGAQAWYLSSFQAPSQRSRTERLRYSRWL